MRKKRGSEDMAAALILSGGTGARMGTDVPKQYIKIGGRSIISYCIEALSCHEGIDSIQITADGRWHEAVRECLKKYDRNSKFRGFSAPGDNRQLSILSGLSDIRKYAGDDGIVLIHDAARPMLSGRLITDCLEAATGHDGALPVLPMKDTVYLSADQVSISGLLNRREVFAGQAPEAFLIGKYYEANISLLPDKILAINGAAEPAVMAGMDIALLAGDEGNFKITTREDLERFSDMIKKMKEDEKR